ncbi:hypothetical protein GEMRC1_010159 [Eukaryota sp. GEM-RC1]
MTSLGLSYCNLHDVDLLRITDSLRLNSALNVKALIFRGNSLGDETATALVQVLRVKTAISKIDLWGNSIGNDGAVALSKVLKLNSTIEFINLGNNPIIKRTRASIKRESNNRIIFPTS